MEERQRTFVAETPQLSAYKKTQPQADGTHTHTPETDVYAHTHTFGLCTVTHTDTQKIITHT